MQKLDIYWFGPHELQYKHVLLTAPVDEMTGKKEGGSWGVRAEGNEHLKN